MTQVAEELRAEAAGADREFDQKARVEVGGGLANDAEGGVVTRFEAV